MWTNCEGKKAPPPNSFGPGPKGLVGSPRNVPTRSQRLVGDSLFPSEFLREVCGRILGGESFLLLSPPSLFSICCRPSLRELTSIDCSQSVTIKLQTNYTQNIPAKYSMIEVYDKPYNKWFMAKENKKHWILLSQQLFGS